MKKREYHGHASNGKLSPEYVAWRNIWGRCTRPNREDYKNYGGRGIKVCERWRSFAVFLADMGYKPSPKHEIDRIDNNGDYEPGNVRWVTHKANAINKRETLSITYKGETKPLKTWCEELNLVYIKVWMRLYRLGWPVERALTQ